MSAPESVDRSVPGPEGGPASRGATAAGSTRRSLPTREPFCVDWELSDVAAMTPLPDAYEVGGRG